MENQIIKGTPPLALLPAKNYLFKVSENNYVIEIPRSGLYKDIAPDIFTEDDGEFNILDETNGILYLPSITKVLFATSKYPDLKFNQFFIPYSLHFKKDIVVIIGQVVDMMLPMKENTDIGDE